MTGHRDPDWVTWPEAAEIAGCPVPTIDWYTRSGRIQKRPRHGARPSLNRASVENFATWWQQRQTSAKESRAASTSRARTTPRTRAERHRRSTDRGPLQPPDPRSWRTAAQAADTLGVSPSTALRMAKKGSFPAVLLRGRWWIDQRGIEKLAQDRSRWISFAEAGRMAGCSANTIGRAVKRGLITQRPVTNRALPSLDRSSAMRFAETRAAAKTAAAEARTARPTRQSGPPDDGDVWLDTRTTALLLGISITRVAQLARRGRLPCTDTGGRRWFRRSHIEQIAAARVLARRCAG